MVRWIVLACVVIVLTVLATFALMYTPESSVTPAFLPNKGEGPPPKFELVGSPDFYFGTMPKRVTGTHSWEIKNVGQGVLDLWLEETSCSCTVAKLTDEKSDKENPGTAKKTVKIPPGKTAPIEVTWETRDWNAFAQTVTLGTNDPEKSVVTLMVRGKILPPVAVEPSSTVSFPNAANEQTHRASVRILSPDQAGLKITKIINSKPNLIITETKPMTPEELKPLNVKSGYHLDIQVKPGLPLGPFKEELVVQTDNPTNPETKITIAGKITGPISVFPEKLDMLNVPSRDGASRELSLVVRGGKETHFEVLRAPEKFKITIVPDEKSNAKGRYRMTVTVPAGHPVGFIDKPIILKTDHPQISQIEIPVNVFVARSTAG